MFEYGYITITVSIQITHTMAVRRQHRNIIIPQSIFTCAETQNITSSAFWNSYMLTFDRDCGRDIFIGEKFYVSRRPMNEHIIIL